MNHSTRSLLIIFIIALFTITVTSCIPILSLDYSLKIGLFENWTLEATIVPMAGLENEVVGEMNSLVNNEELLALGVQAKVETLSPLSDGSVPVKLNLKGRGYETLNHVVGEQTITVDKSNIRSTLYFNSSMSQQPGIQSATFSLSGGEILDHNGTLVNSKTVSWSNYSSSMYAAMKEPSLLDYLPYFAFGCICLISVLVIVLLVLGLSRNKRKKTKKIESAKQTQVFEKSCVHCNSIMPINADFCPMCGARQN